MAPTLRGPHVVADCPGCGQKFEVGAEFAADAPCGDCPRCGDSVPLAGLAIHPGDRLWIDRTAFARRGPRRPEVVVAHNPEDGSQLCVKRVVGLPGETVEIRQGDVWIDGRPWAKSLAEQRAFRTPLLREGERVTDNFAYNAGLSRSLNLVGDFMLSARLEVRGEGTLTLDLHDGRQDLRVTLTLPSGRVVAAADDEPLAETVFSEISCRQLARGPVLLELSNFDRQLLLAIDSRVELCCPLDAAMPPPAGTARPFAIRATGLELKLSDQKVYHDVYFCRQAVGLPPAAERVKLAEDEYYLLGDNSPVSVDSRSWRGVPARHLVGKPLGVR
jgi:type IV secretory pathway protease TraF